jgi:hypothetical protein
VADRRERFYMELDRQMSEVRAAVDGVTTRGGLLTSAAAVHGAVVAARIEHAHKGLSRY